MANTITNSTIVASRAKIVKYITIASDGSEETDLVIYDSSAIATTLGIADPTDCTLLEVCVSVSAAATARAFLEWDATTDVLALDLPATRQSCWKFCHFGGLPNQGAAGKTGDITLTTTGLEAGDAITLILVVRPN